MSQCDLIIESNSKLKTIRKTKSVRQFCEPDSMKGYIDQKIVNSQIKIAASRMITTCTNKESSKNCELRIWFGPFLT